MRFGQLKLHGAWLLPAVAALGLLAAFAPTTVKADEQTITGTVVGADGAPAANAQATRSSSGCVRER